MTLWARLKEWLSRCPHDWTPWQNEGTDNCFRVCQICGSLQVRQIPTGVGEFVRSPLADRDRVKEKPMNVEAAREIVGLADELKLIDENLDLLAKQDRDGFDGLGPYRHPEGRGIGLTFECAHRIRGIMREDYAAQRRYAAEKLAKLQQAE